MTYSKSRDSWNAQVVRLTLFGRETLEAAGLWQKIVGEEPEVDEHKPREGLRRQFGPVGDARLGLGTRGDRLDLGLSPLGSEGPEPLENIGRLDEALGSFRPLAEKLLDEFRGVEVLRLAFGLIGVMPVADQAAAYRALAKLVPSVKFEKLDPKTSRDTLFQINRPKQSRVVMGAELNRITKWQALEASALRVMISREGAHPTGQRVEGHFVRCECDHSTPVVVPDTRRLDPGQLPAVLDELIEMAVENLERGEIP